MAEKHDKLQEKVGHLHPYPSRRNDFNITVDIPSPHPTLNSNSLGPREDSIPPSAPRQHEPINGQEKESPRAERQRREWEFVEDQEDNEMITCKICFSVIVAPHLITCCGRCACKPCFDKHFSSESARGDGKRRCPFCREKVFRLIENSALKRSINQLKVYCLYRRRGCKWSGKLQDGESHLKECQFCPGDCPNGCGCEQFEKRSLRDHLMKCPLQLVECSFEQLGCKTDHHLTRKDAEVHSNKDIHHHLILLARSNLKMYEDSDIALASFRSSHGEIVRQKNETILSKRQELAFLEQTIESLEVNLLELQGQLTKLKQDGEGSRARCTAELNAKAEQTRGLHDVCQVSLAEVQALPVPQTTSFVCPPVAFTINNFSMRKAHNEQWISPPFYTHFGGYKMCLSVYPNGSQDAKGNHVSVFFHMMSGEFDEHLTWPFPGAVINICALTQRSGIMGGVVGARGNFGADIDLIGQVTRDCRSRVFDGSCGPGYGRLKYIPHNQVSQYLAGDTFKILIFHIQFIPL